MKFSCFFPIRPFVCLLIFLATSSVWNQADEFSQSTAPYGPRNQKTEAFSLLKEENLPSLSERPRSEGNPTQSQPEGNPENSGNQKNPGEQEPPPKAKAAAQTNGLPHENPRFQEENPDDEAENPDLKSSGEADDVYFRKVFVPQDLLHAIPTDSAPYWRMNANEFEEWISQFSADRPTSKPTLPPILAEQAIYRAELIENKFLRGTASIQIRRAPTAADCASATNSPQQTDEKIVSWSFQCGSLALEDELRVSPVPGNSDASKNASQTGTFTRREFHFHPSGNTEALFSEDDFDENNLCQAEFNWSRSLINDENGISTLDLEWIAAVDSQWILAIPPQWIPETTDGLVMPFEKETDVQENRKNRQLEALATAPSETLQDPNAISPQTESTRTGNGSLKYWRILFGGKNKARLTLRPADSPALPQTAILASQTVIYQLRKEGMDVFARVNLDSFGEESNVSPSPIRRLALRMEKNLVPTAIRFNEKDVKWQIVSSSGIPSTENSSPNAQPASEFVYLSLELPEELKGNGNRLEINAIGNVNPWFSEGTDRLLPLPQIQLSGVFRKECRTQIQIFDPLSVSDFSLEEATLIACSKIPGLSRFQIEFQEHSDQAKFNLALTQRSAPLEIDLATMLDFQEREILAVTELRANCHGGEYFEIYGIVDLSWMIDSVETDSSGFIEDWNLEILQKNIQKSLSELNPNGGLPEKLANSGWNLENLGILKIQLARSVRPGRPFAFRIRARRPGYPSQTFTGIQLTPVFFPSCQINQSWLLALSSSSRLVRFLPPYREQKTFWEDLSEKNGGARPGSSPFPSSTERPASPDQNLRKFQEPSETQTTPRQTLPPQRIIHDENGSRPDWILDEEGSSVPEITLSETAGRRASSSPTDDASIPDSEKIPASTPQTERFLNPNRKSAKDLSFAGYPTLQAAQKLCPQHIEPLIGIQDFKNIPMLYLENSVNAFSAKISGSYDISQEPEAVYRISCNPLGTEINRLKILIRPGVLLGVNWKFPPALQGAKAVCLNHAPIRNSDELASSFELWEITFPQAQREPFEFEMVLLTIKMLSESPVALLMENGSTPEYFNLFKEKNSLWDDYLALNPREQYAWWKNHFPDGFFLPLIDVPDARECSGNILVKNDVKDSIQVETQEMIPTLLPLREISEISDGNSLKDVCLYRFDPHAISNTPEPFLKLHWRKTALPLPCAWIWKKSSQSQFFANGRILHSVELLVENVGAREFDVKIQHDRRQKLEILSILVNGIRIPFEKINISDDNSASDTIRELTIPFPSQERKNRIMIQWLEQRPALHVFASLTPPRISTNLKELQSDWKIWVPEDFVVLSPSQKQTKQVAPFRKISETKRDAFHSNDAPQRLSSRSERPGEGNALAQNPLSNPQNPQLNPIFHEHQDVSRENSPKMEKDSIFLRLFGPLRLGKSIFSRPETPNPEEINPPIPLDSNWIRQLTSLTAEPEKTPRRLSSHMEILSLEQTPHSVVGWNFWVPKETQPVFVIYGNILESARWFLLILTCVLTSWLLAPYRPLRIFLCGTAAVLCMTVPLAWTPVFSGIFLGIIAAFIRSSVYRRQKYVSENAKPVVLVKNEKKRTQTIQSTEITDRGAAESMKKRNFFSFFNSKSNDTEKNAIPDANSTDASGKTYFPSSQNQTDSSDNHENSVKNSETVQ